MWRVGLEKVDTLRIFGHEQLLQDIIRLDHFFDLFPHFLQKDLEIV
jgi:hypothetical protein